MPSYFSGDFFKDWRYAVERNYESSDGIPATWGPSQPQHYGEENAHLAIPKHTGAASLNADESLIAVGVENEIHIYTTNLPKPSLHQILKGHVSRVDALEFHPTNPNVLLSCAMNITAEDATATASILFWKLKEQSQRKLITERQATDTGNDAVATVERSLIDSASAGTTPWTMTGADKKALGEDFAKAIVLQNIQSQNSRNVSLHGRLVKSFGSQAFNSDGSSIAHIPGDIGDHDWDICIYDTQANIKRFTLVGHKDVITWIGFSPDDKYVASVAWDQSFRIWSHATGELIHTFQSNGQNWTGAFSKDSRFFAGTSGEGRFWVWDIIHGIEAVSYQFPYPFAWAWCRTLVWSPSGDELMIGSPSLGRLIIYNIKRQEIVQTRVLSTKKMPEDVQEMAAGFLEVTTAKYLPEKRFGRKIMSRTTGDNAVEVYDRDENKIWRFGPRQGVDEGWSGSTFVLERQGLIASVDDSAIRFWKLPTLSEG